jgi:hypothetical protein
MIKHFEIVYETLRSLFITDKEKTLHFDEIDLTISIPKGLKLLTEKQIKAKGKKNKLSRYSDLNIFKNNTDCRALFLATNVEKSFMSGTIIPLKERTENEATREYHELLNTHSDHRNKITKKFSRVYFEKKMLHQIISNIPFEKDEVIQRIPERMLVSTYSYHGFYKNYQIIFDVVFRDQDFGLKILESIENSIFAAASGVIT